MFEPIHGSAPKHAGKGVASPLGAILAVSMMLDYIGEHEGSQSIESAVEHLLSTRALPSVDTRSALSTSHTGDMVVDHLARAKT